MGSGSSRKQLLLIMGQDPQSSSMQQLDRLVGLESSRRSLPATPRDYIAEGGFGMRPSPLPKLRARSALMTPTGEIGCPLDYSMVYDFSPPYSSYIGASSNLRHVRLLCSLSRHRRSASWAPRLRTCLSSPAVDMSYHHYSGAGPNVVDTGPDIRDGHRIPLNKGDGRV